MEQLYIKLIKGYNLSDVINHLQISKNQKLNLQNELKEMAKKEKTNLILLNKNKLLTQTLELSKTTIDINSDEESTYFDHIEQIESDLNF